MTQSNVKTEKGREKNLLSNRLFSCIQLPRRLSLIYKFFSNSIFTCKKQPQNIHTKSPLVLWSIRNVLCQWNTTCPCIYFKMWAVMMGKAESWQCFTVQFLFFPNGIWLHLEWNCSSKLLRTFNVQRLTSTAILLIGQTPPRLSA